MKLYARIIAFLCAMLMLTACFSACAETNNPETTTEEPAQTVGPDDSVGAETQRVDKNGYLLIGLMLNVLSSIFSTRIPPTSLRKLFIPVT